MEEEQSYQDQTFSRIVNKRAKLVAVLLVMAGLSAIAIIGRVRLPLQNFCRTLFL